jgi:hypothetical protein
MVYSLDGGRARKGQLHLRLRKLGTARSSRDLRQAFPADSLIGHHQHGCADCLSVSQWKVDLYQIVTLSSGY